MLPLFDEPIDGSLETGTALLAHTVQPYRTLMKGRPEIGLFEDHEAPLDYAQEAARKLATVMVGTYQPIEVDGAMPPDMKWRYISAIQKLLRRGRGDVAAQYMMWMIQGGESDRIWKRMNVIIAEDIGMGDPLVSIICLYICTFKQFRAKMGEARCVNAVCSLLAGTIKSRDMTDTYLWATSQGRPMDPELAKQLDPAKVISILSDRDQPVYTRLHAWALIRGHGKTVSNKSKRLEAFRASKTPTMIQYLAERTKTSSGYDLGLACPLIWEWMSGADEIRGKSDMYPPKLSPMIGGVPAYAYDMHVWEGKSSITYFVKANKPVKEWFEHNMGRTLDSGDKAELEYRKRVISYALFWAEGGALDKRLTWTGHNELFTEFRLSEGEHAGVKRDLWDDLCYLVYTELPAMHEYRKRIIEK